MNTCMDPLSHNSHPFKLLLHNNRPTLGLSRPEKSPPESSQEKKKPSLAGALAWPWPWNGAQPHQKRWECFKHTWDKIISNEGDTCGLRQPVKHHDLERTLLGDWRFSGMSSSKSTQQNLMLCKWEPKTKPSWIHGIDVHVSHSCPLQNQGFAQK